MKRLLALATISIAAVSIAGVVAQVPTKVYYITAAQAEKMMLDRSQRDGAMVDDPGLRIMVNTREPGPAELHEKTNHVFIMKEGEGTFVTGGKLIGQKRTAPDEFRADSIEGGTTYNLKKGDIIVVPANTPHWMRATNKIQYYVVNIQK